MLTYGRTQDRIMGRQVMDAKTFRPISGFLDRERGALMLSFGDTVKGEYVSKTTGERTPVAQSFTSPFFAYETYSYVLRALPLRAGYRAIIPVYAYEAKEKSRPSNIVIQEVTDEVYLSKLTGEHPVWRVDVREEHTANRAQYLVDKATRRLWQVDLTMYAENSGATFGKLIDLELDFQPYQKQFDREAAQTMFSAGTSTIKGRASAYLMPSYNGRRYAQKGSPVFLIPDTPFYREWVAVNEQRSQDNLAPLPFPEGGVKVAEVHDDKGGFEFTDLQPGKYVLTADITYQYGYSQTVQTGRSAVYYKNTYQGDAVHYGTVRRGASGDARAEAEVTINRDGETAEVKLTARTWSW